MGFRYATGRLYKPRTVSGVSYTDWWDLDDAITGCVAAYQPKGAASYAASLADLSGSGNNATEGTAPDWTTDNGWAFNGTSHYLDTGIVPTTDSSVVVRISDKAGSTYDYIFGQRTAANSNVFLFGNYDSTDRLVYYFGQSSSVYFYDTSVTSGVFGMKLGKAYHDGVAVGTIGDPATYSTALSIYVGSCNNYGTAGSFIQVKVQAFALYNTPLSDDQFALLSTAMNAL